MMELSTPVDNLSLIERINLITPYEVPRSTLISLFNKSQGNNVTSILPLDKFNEWFEAIHSGKSFEFVDTNAGKIVPLSYSIENDEYFKFINFTAYEKFNSGSFTLLGMTLAFEKNSNNVYLDTKTVFQL